MVIPKHHMAFHLPDQYLRDGCYMDCFAMERHHKLAKAEVQLLNDTTMKKYEFFVLSRVHRAMAQEAKDWARPPAARDVMVNGELQLQSCSRLYNIQ